MSLLDLSVLGGVSRCYSNEELLNIEINYNTARDTLIGFLNSSEKISIMIDNVLDLQKTVDTFASTEAMAVVKHLVGPGLDNISQEGFISSAWDHIQEFFKWVIDKLVAFFKWIGEKISALFGSKGSKVTTSENSNLGKIAQKNPKVANIIKTTASDKTDSGDATQKKLTLNQILDLADAMRNDQMQSSVTYNGIDPIQLEKVNKQFADALTKSIMELMPIIASFDDKDVNIVITKLDELRDRAQRILDESLQRIESVIPDNKQSSYDSYAQAAIIARKFIDYGTKMKKPEHDAEAIIKHIEQIVDDMASQVREACSNVDQAIRSKLEKAALAIGNVLKQAAQRSAKIRIKIDTAYAASVTSFCNSFQKAISANGSLHSS